MQIEAKQFVQILKAVRNLSDALGYGSEIYIEKYAETENGELAFFLEQKETGEQFQFILPKAKEYKWNN